MRRAVRALLVLAVLPGDASAAVAVATNDLGDRAWLGSRHIAVRLTGGKVRRYPNPGIKPERAVLRFIDSGRTLVAIEPYSSTLKWSRDVRPIPRHRGCPVRREASYQAIDTGPFAVTALFTDETLRTVFACERATGRSRLLFAGLDSGEMPNRWHLLDGQGDRLLFVRVSGYKAGIEEQLVEVALPEARVVWGGESLSDIRGGAVFADGTVAWIDADLVPEPGTFSSYVREYRVHLLHPDGHLQLLEKGADLSELRRSGRWITWRNGGVIRGYDVDRRE